MQKLVVGALTGLFIVGLQVSSVLAFHCPALVKECEALVGKMENSPRADKAQVTKAKQGCADAKKLHDEGSHADSVIKVGEAIAQAGKSAR